MGQLQKDNLYNKLCAKINTTHYWDNDNYNLVKDDREMYIIDQSNSKLSGNYGLKDPEVLCKLAAVR